MTRPDLHPDPKPELDRPGFRDTWIALQALKAPHLEQLQRVENAETAFLEMTAGGYEPEAWCESCGAPFFDGDDYQSDDEGVVTCRSCNEPAPAYAGDADGNRVGRCFAELMGE